MKDISCNSCCFFHRAQKNPMDLGRQNVSQGECFRYPPTVNIIGVNPLTQDLQQANIRPAVFDNTPACGEHRPLIAVT